MTQAVFIRTSDWVPPFPPLDFWGLFLSFAVCGFQSDCIFLVVLAFGTLQDYLMQYLYNESNYTRPKCTHVETKLTFLFLFTQRFRLTPANIVWENLYNAMHIKVSRNHLNAGLYHHAFMEISHLRFSSILQWCSTMYFNKLSTESARGSRLSEL